MRAARHGHRAGTSGRGAPSLSAPCAVGCVLAAGDCQRHQHWRRSRRHGRNRRDDDGHQVALLDAVLRRLDCVAALLVVLSSDCADLQMAHARLVRLCDGRFPGASGLECRAARDLCAARRMVERLPGDLRRHSGDDHFAVSFFSGRPHKRSKRSVRGDGARWGNARARQMPN